MEEVTKMASEKPVVTFSRSSCCICHNIKTLLRELPCSVLHELDEYEIPRGMEIEQALPIDARLQPDRAGSVQRR